MSIIKTERSRCVCTRTHTSSLRNIDNLVRLVRPAAIFSLSSVCMCMCVRKKKETRAIFVLLKEPACTHQMYECMYVWKKKNSACVWSRSDNDNVTKLRKEKEKKEPCTCGHRDRMYDAVVSPRFRAHTVPFR